MRIEKVHHIGIRVSDELASVEFYARFGFRVVYRDAHDPVLILVNEHGVELNFIVNAGEAFDGKNRLMDVPQKFPGYTHVAFKVQSMDDTVAELEGAGIPITEGPRQLGPGISVFIRDPDANVIELRQDVQQPGA